MTAVDSFEAAFVATGYLLGRRSETLLLGLPSPAARCLRIHSALCADDRARRAKALARELAPLIKALEARNLR